MITNTNNRAVKDGIWIKEVAHDSTLIGKGTSRYPLRIRSTFNPDTVHDSTIYGKGTTASPLTLVRDQFRVLDENGDSILDEQGNPLFTENYGGDPFYPIYTDTSEATTALGDGPASFFWTTTGPCLCFKWPNSTNYFQIYCD